MKTYVYGNNEHIRKHTRQMLNLCANKIVTKRLADTLYLNVHIKGYDEMAGVFGDTEYLDSEAGLRRPKRFRINIGYNSRVPLKNYLMTVAHEFVHVKQFARGELKYNQKGNFVFHKRTYKRNNEYNYMFMPWEVEAQGFERSMIWEYADLYGMTKKLGLTEFD